MNRQDSDEPLHDDELDQLLAAVDRDPVAPRTKDITEVTRDAREDLRRTTLRRLTVRKRLRQIVRWTSLSACYLAGAATLYGWQHWAAAGEGTRSQESAAIEAPSDHVAKAPPIEKSAPVAAVEPGEQSDQPAAPRRAHVKQSRFAALRALGDQHLLDGRDPDKALRCYRMALRYATDEELAIASRDGTWLLRTICNDPTMEKNHDHSKKS